MAAAKPDPVENLDVEAAPYNEYEQKAYDAIVKHFGEDVIKGLPKSMVTRFIRGYSREKDPIPETITKLDECLKWRKEKNVDHILDQKLEGLEDFRKRWPVGLHGRGKCGRPVYVERLGHINPDDIYDNYAEDQVEKFHVYMMEQLTHFKDDLSVQYGKSFYKHIVIIDLNGFGTKHMGNRFRGPMKAMLHIDQHYYPESLHKMIVINAPWVFKMLWKIVRPWIHPLTRERIKIGNEFLAEYIDADQIPQFIEGGKCKCAEGKCLEVPFSDGRPDTITLENVNQPRPNAAAPNGANGAAN